LILPPPRKWGRGTAPWRGERGVGNKTNCSLKESFI
jgi:hypothetical protein